MNVLWRTEPDRRGIPERGGDASELVAGLNAIGEQWLRMGGGGHQAHLNGTTTHGHIWLLPEEMRRPWR